MQKKSIHCLKWDSPAAVAAVIASAAVQQGRAGDGMEDLISSIRDQICFRDDIDNEKVEALMREAKIEAR